MWYKIKIEKDGLVDFWYAKDNVSPAIVMLIMMGMNVIDWEMSNRVI